MRLATVSLLFLCGTAFGQDDPNNAAAESAKKRISGMKLMKRLPRIIKVVADKPNSALCAIPLLNAMPSGGAPSRMPVMKPGEIPEPGVREPAPSCGEGLVQNK
jgi:hypothetical protein